jgi:hypothetical protein
VPKCGATGLTVHFYPAGYLCDEHNPAAQKAAARQDAT